MAKKPPPRPKPKKARHFVHEWRKYRKLTQEELAERIGVTPGAISQLENGIVNYTQPTLEALAVALECEPGDILSKDPRLSPPRPELAELMALAADMPRTFLDHLIGMMTESSKAGELPPAPLPASQHPKPAKEKSY